MFTVQEAILIVRVAVALSLGPLTSASAMSQQNSTQHVPLVDLVPKFKLENSDSYGTPLEQRKRYRLRFVFSVDQPVTL